MKTRDNGTGTTDGEENMTTTIMNLDANSDFDYQIYGLSTLVYQIWLLGYYV